ncbi:hypothetical protein AAHA92_06129 [Salvia divinorum]|uniref:Uncharacterized protein n=1 Tax=Salvia divinorum TaxID=28513 RepID=A0ABD1I7V7_SALDI
MASPAGAHRRRGQPSPIAELLQFRRRGCRVCRMYPLELLLSFGAARQKIEGLNAADKAADRPRRAIGPRLGGRWAERWPDPL